MKILTNPSNDVNDLLNLKLEYNDYNYLEMI